MSTDAIVTLLIMVPLTIWLASLSIRATKSDEPHQYDPAKKLGRFFRVSKIFIRRFGFLLVVIGISVNQLSSEITPTILAVIALSISVSWLVAIVFKDRVLRHIIELHEKNDSLKDEIDKIKT